MKYLQLYACDKCGQEFREEEECAEHENGHIEPSDYNTRKSVQYSKDGKYPDTISVEMADGATVLYSFFAVNLGQKNSPPATENSEED